MTTKKYKTKTTPAKATKKNKTKKTKKMTTQTAKGLVLIPVPAQLAYQIGLIIGRDVIQLSK